MSAYAASKDVHNVSEAFQKAEFFAEDQLIEISPMVRSGVVSLLCGNFGPFEPSITSTVPLWLALALKKVHRCKLLPPRWLTLDRLRYFIQSETENEEQLHDIPFYFFEVSSLLLHHAADDVQEAGRVRRYVEDLANARDSKMRRWMQGHVRDRVNAVKINHLTLHEIQVHRPVLTEILGDLYDIHVRGDGGAGGVMSQSEGGGGETASVGTGGGGSSVAEGVRAGAGAGGGLRRVQRHDQHEQQPQQVQQVQDSAGDEGGGEGGSETQGQGHRLRRVIRGNT